MRSIELTQGRAALVDDDDYEWLSQWKWHARWSGQTWYARRHARRPDGGDTTVEMHRLVLDAPAGLQVDHKNHDGLDNRRANLRLATSAQNGSNRRLGANSASGYKGVIWHERLQRWWARIAVNGNRHDLGYFATAEAAAAAYDSAAIKYHGEFAKTNADIPERSVTRTGQPVTAAVKKLIAGLTLDEMGEARAAVAVALAERIDSTATATTGAAAMAAAGLSRELQVTLEAIMVPANAQDADKFLRQLLSTEAT